MRPDGFCRTDEIKVFMTDPLGKKQQYLQLMVMVIFIIYFIRSYRKGCIYWPLSMKIHMYAMIMIVFWRLKKRVWWDAKLRQRWNNFLCTRKIGDILFYMKNGFGWEYTGRLRFNKRLSNIYISYKIATKVICEYQTAVINRIELTHIFMTFLRLPAVAHSTLVSGLPNIIAASSWVYFFDRNGGQRMHLMWPNLPCDTVTLDA